MPGQTWERLYEVAVDQYGFVTRDDARDVGVDPDYLHVLVGRGVIGHTGVGLFRFPEVPVTERTGFMEAVLWVGRDAALSHDAVLALHGLAFANPSVIRVVTPHRVRRSKPPPTALKVIRRTLPDSDRTRYFGIPSTTVSRALLDSGGLIMRSRLIDAARDARREGLLRESELDRVLEQLERPMRRLEQTNG